ncbi:MAG: response regulator [Pseudomonadota bacterium]
MDIFNKKILCIDDDAFTRQMIVTYLKSEGFNVLEGENGQDLKEICSKESIDLIILDLVLPDEDGIALTHYLRNSSKNKNIAIIMISAKGEDVDRIIGIETGADDYMGKPFLPRELKARIISVLKRYNFVSNDKKVENHSTVYFGEWRLEPSQYQAFDKESESAYLTTSEFIILQQLVMHPQRTLTREYIFEMSRNAESETFDRAVDVQITRIRKKIRDNARSPKYIKTVRGVGYLFCAEVSNVA